MFNIEVPKNKKMHLIILITLYLITKNSNNNKEAINPNLFHFAELYF